MWPAKSSLLFFYGVKEGKERVSKIEVLLLRVEGTISFFYGPINQFYETDFVSLVSSFLELCCCGIEMRLGKETSKGVCAGRYYEVMQI